MVIQKVKEAVECLQAIEQKAKVKIFNPKGLAYCTAAIKKHETQMKMKEYIDEAIGKRLDSFEDKLLQRLAQASSVSLLTEEDKEKKLNDIVKIIDDPVKKLTWERIEETDELVVLKCSNGHQLTIFVSKDGQKIANIDNGENIQVSSRRDIEGLKKKIETM